MSKGQFKAIQYRPMRVLLVIHGYPMRYNAGSEVYTQTLAQGLAHSEEVRVFTRQDDPLLNAYDLVEERDPSDDRIGLRVINNPASRDRYRHDQIDQTFAELLYEFEPDIVHVNHVSHLSTSILRVVKNHGLPLVFTLHDYWLMCPRGQFIQRTENENGNLYPVCDGQEDRKCADRCYSIYYSGAKEHRQADSDRWTAWVGERMRHIQEMSGLVDRFIAPSRHLMERLQQEFDIPAEKLVYLDYGFDIDRLGKRKRLPESRFVFGYIGTHIPAKGMHNLLDAFAWVKGDPVLRIWGRPRSPYTDSLRVKASALPNGAADRIEWLGEYENPRIIADVFDRVDAIVVPSIWDENSPLVIHEAQQARVPVITSNVGGMAEYVHHGVNGLLFEHRSVPSLADRMQSFAANPAFAKDLGSHGYLYSDTGDVSSISEHLAGVKAVYRSAMEQSSAHSDRSANGPWRITFDTNPDDCNLKCIMCEEHSLHSDLQRKRRVDGRPKRRMPIETIRSVLQDCAGKGLREIIPSTMGEPLLYKHFDEIIDLCHEFGVKMNLTTNGTFPSRGATSWAERIVPVTSDVKISINGCTAETQESIMLGTRLDTILDNVRAFVAIRDTHAQAGGNRCRVTFQTTFLESNIDELPEMVCLAVSLGVDRVKGHHLWAHFTQIEGLSMRRSSAAIERWNEVVRQTKAAAEHHYLPNGSRVLLENIYSIDPNAPGDIAPEGECPFLGREAWVNAEGRFDPCCAPDALRRTLGDFGNVDEHSLMEIWTSPEYEKLRTCYMENRLCQTCNMRRPKVEPHSNGETRLSLQIEPTIS
jgi:glycosyltransferase involved in cell wall biosynthesis/MoaA/NifB/PqqE/SkfB family radical SAM enzyme